MFTYLFDDFPLENIFFFYGLTEFIYAYRSGLKALSSLLVQDSFRSLYPEFGTRFTPICSRRPRFQKLIFLFPISADERRGLFPLWDSSHSFGFYLLPSPVRRFVRATICPCTPLFTHPVIEYKHLLVSILTWICYLRNWPRFLFQRSVLGPLIQIRRNSSNPLFLFSQWETTWQYKLRCRVHVRLRGGKRVWPPVWLLYSLSDKQPWERYEPSYFPGCGLPSTFELITLGKV